MTFHIEKVGSRFIVRVGDEGETYAFHALTNACIYGIQAGAEPDEETQDILESWEWAEVTGVVKTLRR